MVQGRNTHIKKYLTRQMILGVITLSLWLFLFLGVKFFHIPFKIYVENVESPWLPITAPTYPELGVMDIEFANSTHGWIGGEDGFIMATTDGGSSWYPQNSGINFTLRAIDFFNPQAGVVISDQDGTILITQNGGKNWTVLEKAKYPHPQYGWVEAMLWDAEMCDEDTAWVLGTKGCFFRVNISNYTCTFVSYLNLSLSNLAMVNTTHGWAVGSPDHIVHTRDGWQTFEHQNPGVSKYFHSVFFWNYNKGWVGGYYNTILATTNGGKTWRIQYSYRPLIEFGSSPSMLDIVFVTEHKGWAVGGYGIHCTENGGKSWMNLGSQTWGPLRIASANETHGWAVTTRKDQSYITTTGGFPPLNENPINCGVALVMLFGFLLSMLILRVVNRRKQF